MCEKFKASQADALFDASFVKVPLSGARYKELNNEIRRAFTYNSGIKYVVRGLDINTLIMDKDAIREDYNPPEFLYNNSILDDVSYVFNKTLFLKNLSVLKHTQQGLPTTSFDDYAITDGDPAGNAAMVLSTYSVGERAVQQTPLSDEERQMIYENLQQNVIDVIAQNPQTQFYYFFTPCSIAYWDELDSLGTLERELEAIAYATEELIKYPNLKLFNFCLDSELICELANYKDQVHYCGYVCSWLLEYMADGKYLVTPDNALQVMEEMAQLYLGYDYEALHAQED